MAAPKTATSLLDTRCVLQFGGLTFREEEAMIGMNGKYLKFVGEVRPGKVVRIHLRDTEWVKTASGELRLACSEEKANEYAKLLRGI